MRLNARESNAGRRSWAALLYVLHARIGCASGAAEVRRRAPSRTSLGRHVRPGGERMGRAGARRSHRERRSCDLAPHSLRCYHDRPPSSDFASRPYRRTQLISSCTPTMKLPGTIRFCENLSRFASARATVHARQTLLSGWILLRDLGTEGAGYADVGLKEAIEAGIIPGPRLLVTTKAIVATGAYGPKAVLPDRDPPLLGAETADGLERDHPRACATRSGRARTGSRSTPTTAGDRTAKRARPSASKSCTRMVEVARSSGRPVVAHASTAEGMRRATLAGVETIEHGDGGTPEVFRLMKEQGVALCPTRSGRRRDPSLPGLGAGARPGAGLDQGQAREPGGRTRRRCDALQWERRRRLRAWRQRARARAAGRLRGQAGGRAPRGHFDQCARAPHGGSRWAEWRRVSGPTSSASRAIRSRISRRCAR